MDSETCKIILVRHGLSELNVKGLIGGQTETPLTKEGVEQVKDARSKFEHLSFDNVYSSDLQRAIHTAEILYGSPVPKENRLVGLRERHFGVLEAQPFSNFGDYTGKIMELPEEERWLYQHAKNMETDDELSKRIIKSIESIASNNLGKTVLIVSHGSAIRVVLIKLGWGDHRHLASGSFKNVGYAEIQYKKGRLEIIDVEDTPRQVVQ